MRISGDISALPGPVSQTEYLVDRGFRTDQRDFAAFGRWVIGATAGPAEPAARPPFAS
jgi:hypothetical protein